MRLPKTVVLGSGNRKWHLTILTHPLSLYVSAYQRVTKERATAPLPAALWNVDTRTVHLRADRTARQRLRDLKHELQHAYVDWLDWAFPDPED